MGRTRHIYKLNFSVELARSTNVTYTEVYHFKNVYLTVLSYTQAGILTTELPTKN